MASAAILALALQAAVVSAAPASTPQGSPAVVAGHSVTDPLDGLRVTVPKSARYVGGERFDLYDTADCQLHVFVDADASKRVRRLYWVQFERMLPSLPDKTYNYADNKRTDLWGGTTWVVSGFGRTEQKRRPGSDREHVTALLAKAGYIAPTFMMQVRFVRLPDDPAGSGHGRRELMLIYGEDLALTAEKFEALGGEGEDTDRWRAIEPALVKRGAAAFSVTTK